MQFRRRSLLGGSLASAATAGIWRSPSAHAATIDVGPWSGAVTSTSAVVKVRLAVVGSAVALHVFETGRAQPTVLGPFTAEEAQDGVVQFRLSGLRPDTDYDYVAEVDGVLASDRRGHFRTFPAPGRAASFQFAFASCAQNGSNHSVFDVIRESHPLFYMNIGDFHYADIRTDDLPRFRSALRSAFANPRQGALYRSTPLIQMWDDHDFGTEFTRASRAPARLAYQEYQCHYPLAAGQGDVPIHQSFVVGRARVIVTDQRSEFVSGQRMLGTQQMQWFKTQLMEAQKENPVVFWVSSMPWIGNTGDNWAQAGAQRKEIANFVKENDIKGLCILSGDAHMLAFDDGRNADYADGGGPLIPVYQGAALDRSGSVKGGPYSGGTFPGSGQFGLISLTDTGSKITVKFSGRRLGEEMLSHSFTVDAPPVAPAAERRISLRKLDEAGQSVAFDPRLEPAGTAGTQGPGQTVTFTGLRSDERHTLRMGPRP